MTLARPLQRLLVIGRQAAQTIRRHLAATTRPARTALVTGTLADAARSRSALIAENALLPHNSSSCGGASSARAVLRPTARCWCS